MAIDYNAGINSIDVGAHDITYSGNQGPKSPDQERQMAFDDTPGFELRSLEELLDEFRQDNNGRDPVSIDDLRRHFYMKYGPQGIAKVDQATKGTQMAAGPVLPSPEDPINPFTPKPTGPDLPEKMMAAQGGRIGFQTGGITQDQRFQPEYIEALGKTYAADLTRQAGIPAITQATQQMPGETLSQFQQRQAQAQQFDITQQSMGLLAPQVAAQDPMQTAAYTQATDATYGLGAYQPYTADARAAAQAAGALTGPMTTAQRTAYMSPYQQDVIDATMTEFDAQAQRRENERAAAALGIPGAYGGGREGVQKAVYQTESDQNRAALLAQLRQTGFQQAQAGRQQDFVNQQALATQQSGLGTQALGNVQRQIAGLGTLGATQQAQNQAVLDAQRQFAGMAVNEPQQRLGMLGQGVTGLMGGMQGYGTTIGQAPPQTSPLGTALGIGSTLAGIYGYMNK